MTPADIRRQMDRILDHPFFAKAPLLAAFLRYTVETVLAGQAEALKESVIGAEVFKRGAAFDPQVDNVVRVNASRLRGRLAEYYLGDGRADRIQIELPKGGYVPIFRLATAGNLWPKPTADSPIRSVGRDEELRQLDAAFENACAGSGSIVVVSGDAGLGKTTLAEDFLRAHVAEAAGWIARGRCSERLSETDAYLPVFECLDGLIRGRDGERAARLLREEAPAWMVHLAPGAGTPPMPAGAVSHDRMRREFGHFFEALARVRPVILFLDDVHWADTSTCDLLTHLCNRIRNLRLLLVITYRPAELSLNSAFPLRIAAERRGNCTDVRLAFLTQADVQRFLGTTFPGNRFPEQLAAVVYERTEGNPLFMTDLAHFLKETRALQQEDDGAWVLVQALEQVRMAVPDSTLSMIRLYIQRLSGQDQRILQCAAVQGIHFDSAVVSQVLALDPETVELRLAALDRVHHFVKMEGDALFPGSAFSVRYRFTHVLYQNALYADLTPTQRASLSKAAARSLATLSGQASREHSATIAVLYETGRDNEGASEHFLHAARHTAAVFAFPETIALCRRGLKALSALPESQERNARELSLRLVLGIAQMSTLGYAAPEVEETHTRARELCLALGDRPLLVRVLWRLHTCNVNGGNLIRALEIAEEMRRVAEDLGATAAIVESLHAHGTTLAFMGRLAESRAALERVFEIAPISEHKFDTSQYVLAPCVTSLSMLARLMCMLGRFDDALEKAKVSLNLAKDLLHPHSFTYASFFAGWIHHLRGEHSEACEQLSLTMMLARTNGLPQIAEWSRFVHGSSLAQLGQVAQGIAGMRQSLDTQLAMHCLVERPYCLTGLAEATILDGRPEQALAICEETLELALRTEGRSFEAETYRVQGLARLAQGDPQAAQPEFQTALRIARERECRFLELRAALSLARLGEPAELRQVVNWFAGERDSPWIAQARELLANGCAA